MESEHGSNWLRYIHEPFPWRCDRDDGLHKDPMLFSRHGKLEDHLRAGHGADIPNDLDTDDYLVRPEDVCSLCCLPLERTEGKTTAPIGQSQATPLPPTARADDPVPTETVGDSSKRRATKSVKFAPDFSTEEHDVAADVDASPASQRRRTQMFRHVASHLQFLTFLTLRLLPSTLADGEYQDFSSSVAITEVDGSVERSTLADSITDVDATEHAVESPSPQAISSTADEDSQFDIDIDWRNIPRGHETPIEEDQLLQDFLRLGRFQAKPRSSYDGSDNSLGYEITKYTEDDTTASTRPLRQVDYLSHDWKEEDIWSSWRYIVTRRSKFANSERLENASSRTWEKVKNNLKTVSPETLNWYVFEQSCLECDKWLTHYRLKDCDVTWLYGPFLPSVTKPIHDTQTEPPSVSLPKTDSLVNLIKKPILKKRRMSEAMLQRALSTTSLLKQVTADVQAQETSGILLPHRHRTVGYFAYPLASRRMSGGSSSLAPSMESSGITSPNTERKHIHFNEQVEQYIAVDVKSDDDEVDIAVDSDPDGDSSNLDDDVMMKRPTLRRQTLKSQSTEGRTITMLPSTTLKYREDTPEPKETAMKHSRSPLMSPSSSQKTLRPSKHSGKFFFGEEDDDEEGLDDALLSPSSG